MSIESYDELPCASRRSVVNDEPLEAESLTAEISSDGMQIHLQSSYSCFLCKQMRWNPKRRRKTGISVSSEMNADVDIRNCVAGF